MSTPSTMMVPDVGLSRAPIRFNSVLLPLPLAPLIAIILPRGSSKLTSSTAGTVVPPDLKCLDSLSTVTIAPLLLFIPQYLRRSDSGDVQGGQRAGQNRQRGGYGQRIQKHGRGHGYVDPADPPADIGKHASRASSEASSGRP